MCVLLNLWGGGAEANVKLSIFSFWEILMRTRLEVYLYPQCLFSVFSSYCLSVSKSG